MPRNSQGNSYSTPGGTNSSSGSSYHYSNTNGSCASRMVMHASVATCTQTPSPALSVRVCPRRLLRQRQRIDILQQREWPVDLHFPERSHDHLELRREFLEALMRRIADGVTLSEAQRLWIADVARGPIANPKREAEGVEQGGGVGERACACLPAHRCALDGSKFCRCDFRNDACKLSQQRCTEWTHAFTHNVEHRATFVLSSSRSVHRDATDVPAPRSSSVSALPSGLVRSAYHTARASSPASSSAVFQGEVRPVW